MSRIPSRIEIPQFPNGKTFAVTTSFDDGRIFDRPVVAAFNEWGLKGTFNLNSGLLQRTGKPAVPTGGSDYLDACEVAELYRGHELAIHTSTHPFLDRLDASQIATEVLEDRKALEELVGYPVRGMAYPYGAYNAQVIEILRALGIVYCRTVEYAMPCFPPTEPLAWPSTAHQFATNPTVPERFQAFLESRQSGVFYVWGHSIEFESKKDWAALERIYKPLSGHAQAWYCTNIELFDYEAARKRIVIAANRASALNPSGIPVWLKVDGHLVEIPAGQTIPLIG